MSRPPIRGIALLLALSLATPAPGEDGVCAQFEVPETAIPEDQGDNVVLTADEAVVTQEGLSLLTGAVRLTQGDREFSAEAISYDRAQNRVSINAESLFRNDNLVVRSQRAEIDLTAETASFFSIGFTLPDRAARGEASKLSLARTGTADLEGASYTTCAEGSKAWLLMASSIHLDPEEGAGTAHHARLTFGRVPILYLPYFQFPIDDRRRSGFLFPTLGNSDNTGLDFRWPYYFNLAPNYDGTLTPRHMGRRGLQWGSDLRYLLPRRFGEGELGYEILERDEVTGTRRSLVEFEHTGLINRRLAFEAEFREVSDDAYFEDLGARLEAAAITHLERSARLTYAAPASYTITTLVQDFQTVDRTVAGEPYRRLPQVRLDAGTRRQWHGTRVGFAGEFVNFERADSEQGKRLDLQPYVRLLNDQNAWYVMTQADYRHTEYWLSNLQTDMPENRSRSLPVYSAEGGLRFERSTSGGSLQILEPRVSYLYVPFRDQDELPIFDSGEPDFDFVQLFARNRFSGEDRVADANHVVTALTTRVLDPTDGTVRLSASLGQIYRFQEPRVTLPDGEPPADGGTDVVGSFDYRLSSRWAGRLQTQWSPTENQLSRNGMFLRYRDANRYARAGYRYRRDFLEQADLTVNTPLFWGWKLFGRYLYSMADDQSLEALGGLEYGTCCWAVRTAYRRYIANTEGDFSTGVYLQLELKGLSRIGAGIEELEPAFE